MRFEAKLLNFLAGGPATSFDTRAAGKIGFMHQLIGAILILHCHALQTHARVLGAGEILNKHNKTFEWI